jgi:peptide deformylase
MQYLPLRRRRLWPKCPAMTIRPILIHPDPRLKTVADPVTDIDDELRQLAEDMLETMYDAPGSGLAAPQVGVLSRMFVMDCAKKEGTPPQPMVLVNPEIVARSEETKVFEEGCLSIPEIYENVERPAEVTMRWLGLDGREHEQDFDGFPAVCVQHELDHRNGKLYIDYLSPLKRQLITRKMQKLKRERARA